MSTLHVFAITLSLFQLSILHVYTLHRRRSRINKVKQQERKLKSSPFVILSIITILKFTAVFSAHKSSFRFIFSMFISSSTTRCFVPACVCNFMEMFFHEFRISFSSFRWLLNAQRYSYTEHFPLHCSLFTFFFLGCLSEEWLAAVLKIEMKKRRRTKQKTLSGNIEKNHPELAAAELCVRFIFILFALFWWLFFGFPFHYSFYVHIIFFSFCHPPHTLSSRMLFWLVIGRLTFIQHLHCWKTITNMLFEFSVCTLFSRKKWWNSPSVEFWKHHPISWQSEEKQRNSAWDEPYARVWVAMSSSHFLPTFWWNLNHVKYVLCLWYLQRRQSHAVVVVQN